MKSGEDLKHWCGLTSEEHNDSCPCSCFDCGPGRTPVERCRSCYTPITGGPGGYYSRVTLMETCIMSPTGFHEA